MNAPLQVGAVMYDPKVSVIWEIIRDFFESQRVPIDVTFYSTYGLQVTVGSWPRPAAVLDAQRLYRRGRLARAAFDRVADDAIVDLLRLQEQAGCDLVTDGELRRDNFYSFVADKLDGVQLMTLAEMLDIVEDKAGFERPLQTLDVPAYSISTRDESTLLRGSYHPLAPYLERLAVDQLVLEYATERAGDLLAFEGKELGLGVVNPRTDTVESAAEISAMVERALSLYEAEQVFLNPDCGFGTFSNRSMNTTTAAAAKVKAMAEAARELRARHLSCLP